MPIIDLISHKQSNICWYHFIDCVSWSDFIGWNWKCLKRCSWVINLLFLKGDSLPHPGYQIFKNSPIPVYFNPSPRLLSFEEFSNLPPSVYSNPSPFFTHSSVFYWCDFQGLNTRNFPIKFIYEQIWIIFLKKKTTRVSFPLSVYSRNTNSKRYT